MDGENHGPLKGLRLTEFTTAWAGPYASCLLAMLGMEVIKVETRTWLDHTRTRSFSTGRFFTNPDESDVFNNLNLNKKSVTLNLKKPKAVEIAKGPAAVSDVIAENMRPGVMERLGLDYESLRQVKPDIVYLSSSSCGQCGPEREYVGYAPTFAALGGASLNTGYEDGPPSAILGVVDLRSATTARCGHPGGANPSSAHRQGTAYRSGLPGGHRRAKRRGDHGLPAQPKNTNTAGEQGRCHGPPQLLPVCRK